MTSSDDTEGARGHFAARGAARLPSSPAAERNKAPILAMLEQVLPEAGVVLEIASGTGQHAVHFAAALPALQWQPSEADLTLVAALEARCDAAALGNVRKPLVIDVRRPPWSLEGVAAVVCINMIHIAPWAAAEGLFAGASGVLGSGSPLVLYGPFKRGGEHTAPSNRAFDASLRARDAGWGVRDVDDVRALATREGFALERTEAMPANNFTLVFRRQ
jgi:hypothetical protein